MLIGVVVILLGATCVAFPRLLTTAAHWYRPFMPRAGTHLGAARWTGAAFIAAGLVILVAQGA